MNDLSILIAFFAGIVSFLSPCVLPIIPGFLAYLAGASGGGSRTVSGTSTSDANSGGDREPHSSRGAIFLNSVFFVLGFSIVFAVLGLLLNTVLAHAAYAVQTWLAWIGGAIVIFFGLYLMGLFRVPFLEFDHKLAPTVNFKSRYLTSLLFGFAFAAGWTPCVGPVLGGILGLAASAPGTALTLLLAYALGLGIPFLIVGLFVAQSSAFIQKYLTKLSWIEPVFGVILVALGILVFTQDLPLVANFGFVSDLLLKYKL